jgi:transposase-like protein
MTMASTTLKLTQLIKHLPQNKKSLLLDFGEDLLNQDDEVRPHCPQCNCPKVEKRGYTMQHHNYICSHCGFRFSSTYGTIMFHSHFEKADWQVVLDDTIEGFSLDHTAQDISCTHATAFYMRHKFLAALVQSEFFQNDILGGVTEMDETYIPDSQKGNKFSSDATRKPRRHGESAVKRGLSNEQICICTGVQRGGKAFAITVNRAKPTSEAIKAAFEPHLDTQSYLFCDDLKSYNILRQDGFTVSNIHAGKAKNKFEHINTVASFQSQIKEQYRKYRGVGTKYLNQYNALSSLKFSKSKLEIKQALSKLLTTGQSIFYTIKQLRTVNLLII